MTPVDSPQYHKNHKKVTSCRYPLIMSSFLTEDMDQGSGIREIKIRRFSSVWACIRQCSFLSYGGTQLQNSQYECDFFYVGMLFFFIASCCRTCIIRRCNYDYWEAKELNEENKIK